MQKQFPPKKPDNSHIIKANVKKNWSSYQKNIFKDIAKATDHTVVIARAGSGKTSTIVEGFRYIPKGKKTLMVAFNKSIADELKQRAPSYVDVFTLHALGFRAIKQTFGEVVLENKKCSMIVSSLIGEDKDMWELNQSICKCVSLCKGFLIDTPNNIGDLMDKFGIETLDLNKEQFIKHVIKALGLCKSQKKVIDFDDMIWFPFVYNLNVGKFDVVLVDEAQDLNAAQIAMVYSAIKSSGRIIAVGDDFQSIYQFRGADSEAIPNIISKLNAKTLPLSVTYRCPKSVVRLAQQIVPDIEAAEDAPEGIVENMLAHDLLKKVKPGDFILSRTNAPLVKHCMALLKAEIPANIQGRDVGANLLYFIKKSKAKTINKFIEYVNSWKEQEIKRLLSEKKDTIVIEDKSECLLNLCEGALTLKDLKATIESLFNDVDDNKKVILSTTHKAKGLERDRVFILVNTYRYGPGVTGEEANLYYVAITRAKKELYLVRKQTNYTPYDDAPKSIYKNEET
jgi:DNA helicase-2/ATP-dependent DNA helicase PcrA